MGYESCDSNSHQEEKTKMNKETNLLLRLLIKVLLKFFRAYLDDRHWGEGFSRELDEIQPGVERG